MKALIYNQVECIVRKDGETLTSRIKPDFSFEYEILLLSDRDKSYQKDGSDYDLTDEQVEEIEAYIDTVQLNPADQLNYDSVAYLVQTDWYVIRQQETGVPVPEEILAKRAAARESIVRS